MLKRYICLKKTHKKNRFKRIINPLARPKICIIRQRDGIHQLIRKNQSINKNQPISKNPFKRRIAYLVRCFFVNIVVKVIQYYINRKQPIEKSRGKPQRDRDGNIILILCDRYISFYLFNNMF